jgi:hypothetical protein
MKWIERGGRGYLLFDYLIISISTFPDTAEVEM